MRAGLRTTAALGLAAAVAGCGLAQSRINPLNWFGRGEPAVVEDRRNLGEGALLVAADPRPLVDQVTALAVERTAGGAIVRAEGLPVRQGSHAVDLVPRNGGVPVDGTLVLGFHAVPDPAAPQGAARSRLVTGGAFVSDADLAGVRAVRVEAARNALVASR